MTFVFIDTNVLLHFKRVEEIDWLGLTNAEAATILLCPAVVRELDRQKVVHAHRRVRKRAQEITAGLYSRLHSAHSEIRRGVTLEFIDTDPRLDFAKFGLRTDIDDDWILASIVEWKEGHFGAEITLVSADLGISIKARAHGIRAIVPLEGDRLLDALDLDEKRIRQLEEQLAEAKERLPALKLAFVDEKSFRRFGLPCPAALDALAVAAEVNALRSRYPLQSFPTKAPDPAARVQPETRLGRAIREAFPVMEIPVPKEEVVRYNSSLEQFYREYEDYLKARHDFGNTQRRTIELELILQNSGTSPADDVDVHLHFPDGFTLFNGEDDDLPECPEAPVPPPRIGTFGFVPNHDISRALASVSTFRPHQVRPPSNVSTPSIKKTNSYDVRLDVKRAKHGYVYRLGKFVIVFSSFETAKSFSIDYSITAANLPRPAAGELAVVIEKAELGKAS